MRDWAGMTLPTGFAPSFARVRDFGPAGALGKRRGQGQTSRKSTSRQYHTANAPADAHISTNLPLVRRNAANSCGPEVRMIDDAGYFDGKWSDVMNLSLVDAFWKIRCQAWPTVCAASQQLHPTGRWC